MTASRSVPRQVEWFHRVPSYITISVSLNLTHPHNSTYYESTATSNVIMDRLIYAWPAWVGERAGPLADPLSEQTRRTCPAEFVPVGNSVFQSSHRTCAASASPMPACCWFCSFTSAGGCGAAPPAFPVGKQLRRLSDASRDRGVSKAAGPLLGSDAAVAAALSRFWLARRLFISGWNARGVRGDPATVWLCRDHSAFERRIEGLPSIVPGGDAASHPCQAPPPTKLTTPALVCTQPTAICSLLYRNILRRF